MGDSSGDSERLRKFVQLAMKLPMDLQMVLCNRASGLSGRISLLLPGRRHSRPLFSIIPF